MKIRDMAQCALFAALLAVCAWISVPVADIAFTMQTFAIALTLLLLGGKKGTLAIFVYLLTGAVGLPVFSGFQGGFGTLLGATGGYITGFLLWGLAYWLITAALPQLPLVKLWAMITGLVLCYGFGSFWFYRIYLQQGSAIGLGFVLAKCVLPFLIPDGIKLSFAWLLARRLKRFV